VVIKCNDISTNYSLVVIQDNRLHAVGNEMIWNKYKCEYWLFFVYVT